MDSYKNFVYGAVGTAPSPAASGTTLVLASDFANPPTPPYNVVIWPAGAQPLQSNAEIARVTADAAGSLTIVRAQEGTSARTVVVGDQVMQSITQKTLGDLAVIDFPGNGSWVSPFGQSNSSVTPVVGTIYLAPFYLPNARTLTRMGLQISGSGSSADTVLRLGLYANVTNGGFGPSALVYDSGAIGPQTFGALGQALSTVTSVSLAPGIYWAGYVFTAATTPPAVQPAASNGGRPSLMLPGFAYYGNGATPSVANGNDGTVATQTAISGALPDPSTAAWVGNSNNPAKPGCIFLRLS